MYVSEGNNIADGHMMAVSCNKWLKVIPDDVKEWKAPYSWNFMEGSKPSLGLY